MRKWFIILLSITGITVVIILGWQNPISRNPGISDRFAGSSEANGHLESMPPNIIIEAVVSTEAETLSILKQATERFEKLRPNVEVHITNVTFHELAHVYREALLSGEGPEVLLYPTSWVRHEAAAGRLRSLDHYVTLERQSQWFETVRGAVRWNGYLWAVPLEWNPYVFVVNADDAEESLGLLSALEKPSANPESYGDALLLGLTGGTEEEREEEEALEPLELETDPEEEQAPEEIDVIRSGDPNSSWEALAAVAAGEIAGAYVPLSEAVRYAAFDREADLAVCMPETEHAAPASLPPFLGHSFVVSPTAEFPVESAEWILYVTDPSVLGRRHTQDKSYWPVYRSMYGLPSTYDAEPPRMAKLYSGDMAAVRAVMRLLDQHPVTYGAPPEEFPNL